MSSTPTASRPAESPDRPAPRSDVMAPAVEPRPRLPLPGFLRARPLEPSDLDPTTDRDPGTSPGPGRDAGPGALELPGIPTPGPSGPRTTSSDSEPRTVSRKELRTAVAGVLMVVAGFAAWTVSRRGTHTLRVPDEDERAAIAAPLAAILDRHVGTAFMTADLVDGVAAASAFAAYIGTNPLSRTGGGDVGDDGPADPFDTRAASAAHGYQEP